jgi:hypothetical protein
MYVGCSEIRVCILHECFVWRTEIKGIGKFDCFASTDAKKDNISTSFRVDFNTEFRSVFEISFVTHSLDYA